MSVYQSIRAETTDSDEHNFRVWYLYVCVTCGGVIMTVTREDGYDGEIDQMWPKGDVLSDDIPERARKFLQDAMDSLHASSVAQIAAASAVDSMLKAKGYTDAELQKKGYKDPKLFTRIKAAQNDHLITDDMAEWAHEVRLDANEQRHADENVPLPDRDDAEKTIRFARALADYLFVLPAMVTRGRATPGTKSP